MAVLSSDDLTFLRQRAARFVENVNYTKAQANAAFQAIEDWEVNGHTARPSGSRAAAIDAAVGTNVPLALEQIMWAVWADWKSTNMGVR